MMCFSSSAQANAAAAAARADAAAAKADAAAAAAKADAAAAKADCFAQALADAEAAIVILQERMNMLLRERVQVVVLDE